MRLLCLLGFHRRSRRRAHPDEAGYVSVCRHCRKPMRRQSNGRWTLSKRNEAVSAGPPPPS
jgi:hypothetical protein